MERKFRLKYVKKVSCFNKAKIYYNDENDFTVVSRYTDSDCDSEDELVLEVVDISDNMNMTRDDLMKFTTDAVLQLNKDIRNPTMPGSLSYPQIEALIVVGE